MITESDWGAFERAYNLYDQNRALRAKFMCTESEISEADQKLSQAIAIWTDLMDKSPDKKTRNICRSLLKNSMVRVYGRPLKRWTGGSLRSSSKNPSPPVQHALDYPDVAQTDEQGRLHFL